MHFLVCIALGLLPLAASSWPCPEETDIFPCTCNSNDETGVINMDCSEVQNNEQLVAAFQAEFPFPDLDAFTMLKRPNETRIDVTELTGSTFGKVSFTSFTISNTNIEKITDSAFNNSLGVVERIIVSHSKLTAFPFDILRLCPKLKDLRVFNNAITHMSNIHSDSLEYLQVSHNPELHFNDDTFLTAPNLVHLLLNEVDLQYIAPDTFATLTKLETLDLSNNRITDLVPLSLRITSKAIKNIKLQTNRIATVEMNSILVEASNVFLWMQHNQLTELPEDVWKPIFDSVSGSSESELFVFDDNPLRCDCGMKWLLSNDVYFGIVGKNTACDDGTLLADVQDFINNHCP